MRRRLFCALLALALCASALGGCEKQPEREEFTTFAMDTVMDFTVYGSKKECSAAHSIVAQLLSDYEALLSATREDSDISRVNQRAGQPVEVDPSVALLLEQALTLCHLTNGALDITAYPAVKAWGFTTGEHRVPSSGELAERLGITPANLSILKTNKGKAIRFSTLDALCRILECQPADILEYIPDESEAS